MRMEALDSAVFYRSGCEYIQEWMRTISDFIEVVANSFLDGQRSHLSKKADHLRAPTRVPRPYEGETLF